MKKAPAIPPNTAPAITAAPTTPPASRYGVPEPEDGFASAACYCTFCVKSDSEDSD
jgi:hypothetical protein